MCRFVEVTICVTNVCHSIRIFELPKCCAIVAIDLLNIPSTINLQSYRNSSTHHFWYFPCLCPLNPRFRNKYHNDPFCADAKTTIITIPLVVSRATLASICWEVQGERVRRMADGLEKQLPVQVSQYTRENQLKIKLREVVTTIDCVSEIIKIE